jgi:cyclohexa-1,5-dienecarbonyl-CoA hydratase
LANNFIKTGSEAGVVTITLDRPPLNVLNIEMMEELIVALRWAGEQPEPLVAITGEGKAFSAGVDIADHTPEKVDMMIDVFDRLFLTMSEIEKPIVALVNGAALGGGYEIVISCDLVVASEKAKLGQPEVKVGVFPPIACYVLPRLLSWPLAMEIILSGDIIDADRAEKIGLVNKVLPAENFTDGAKDFLKRFSELSPTVLALSKKAALAGIGKDFAEGLKVIDRIYLDELMNTDDAIEGLQAFMEKRKPVWRGK